MKDNLARKPALIIANNTPVSCELVKKAPLTAAPNVKTSPQDTFFNEEKVRWISSFLVVLFVYFLALIWWIIPKNTSSTLTPPSAAMVVEIALESTAPASKPDIAPGPEQVDAPPPKPEPKPLPEPEIEPEIPPAPPAIKPEVVVKPKPKEKQEEKPLPEEMKPIEEELEEVTPTEKTVASTASAPPKAAIESTKAAAPNRGISTPTLNNNQKLTWQNQLMLKLNEAKRYPSRARRYRQEGVGYLRFSMDRNGNVLSKSIEQSSGHELLDNETLALIERAQPLPMPPNHVKGDILDFVVPIVFSLRN